MQEIKKWWEKVKFGDVIISNPKISLKKWNIYNFIEMQSVSEWCYRSVNNIDKKEFNWWTKFEEWDILFSRITPCLQNWKIAQVKWIDVGFWSTEYFIFRNIEWITDNKFLFYRLIDKWVIDIAIKSMVWASWRQRADIKSIQDLEILLPPLPIQQKIASILSKYDDLIENNNKRIKILEETAQAIYEEWFVKYNFPWSENIKMVDSWNDDFGVIPEGWKVKKVEDYIDFIRWVEPWSKNYKENKWEDDIVFIRVWDLWNRNSWIYINNDLSKWKIVTEEDVLVTFDWTVWIVKRWFYWCYSSWIRKLSWKEEFISNYFLYLLFKSEQIQNKIKEHAKWTTILHAWQSIKYMEFVLATEDIYKKFNDIVWKVLDEILNIEKQNENLKETRDLLIPRLVSGELDVENLDVK